jgi:hypothetical protein
MINNQDHAIANVHLINAFYAGDGHKVAKWILPAGHYIVAKRHRAERDTIVTASCAHCVRLQAVTIVSRFAQMTPQA